MGQFNWTPPTDAVPVEEKTTWKPPSDAVAVKKKVGSNVPSSGSTLSANGLSSSQVSPEPTNLPPGVSTNGIGYNTPQSPIFDPNTPTQSNLKNAVQAYQTTHTPQENADVESAMQHQNDDGTISQYKSPTFGQKAAYEIKSIGGSVNKGIANATVAPLMVLGNKLGLVSDADKARVLREVAGSDKETFGIDPTALQGSPGGIHNTINQFAFMAPALITASGTGGASFGLQTAGQAATQVQEMKDKGVEFNNHSDDLFILGSGIVGTALGRGTMGSLFNSFGSKAKANIVSGLAADVIKELGEKGTQATADDLAQAFLAKANTFADKVGQTGLKALEQYAKVGTELSAANAATFGTKKLANVISGEEPAKQPFQDTTGEDFVHGIAEPFGIDKDAQGNPLTALGNMATSPAGLFGALGGAHEALGMIGHNPNPVIERLQTDNSPENVQAIKADLATMGKDKGWTDEEIKNAQQGVDLISNTVAKLPKNLKAEKVTKGVQIIMGRNELEQQLKDLQEQRSKLDPSVSEIAAPQEELIQNKIDQANDKLRGLVTGDMPTYSKGTEANGDEGVFYKTTGGVKEEIPQSRYDLENLEREAKKIPKTDVETPIENTQESSEEPTIDHAAETDAKIAEFQKNFPDHHVDPLEDLPEHVVRTFDRVDNDLPTDPVAINEASDWLYNKYKELTKMKESDTRMLTTEQINSMQDQLGEDITTLENHKLKYHGEADQTQPETKADAGTVSESDKAEIRNEIAGNKGEIVNEQSPQVEPTTENVVPTPQEKSVPETTTVEPQNPIAEKKLIENFTTAEIINRDYAKLKDKLGEKGAKKYFEQADRLLNPNENGIVEYRKNGIVTKDGDNYTFHALADMDMKNWRVASKNDVTDQFKKGEENAIPERGATEVPLGETPGNSAEMGGRVPESGEATPTQEAKPEGISSDNTQPKEEVNPLRQKAIDAVVHGLLIPDNLKGNDPSERFDFGSGIDKKKALSDIRKGDYETAPAKKVIDKIMEWEKNGEYPIMRGTGGGTIRGETISADEIGKQIEDAKANKLGELSQRQQDEANKSLADIGITYDDVKAHEDYEKSRNYAEARGNISEDVQQSENDQTASGKQGESDKAPQRSEPKIADKAKELADKIRSLKSDKSKLHGGLEGVAVATWDGALETIATSIETGGKLADAINEGVKHILNAHPELKEAEVQKRLEDEINGVQETDKAEPIDEEGGKEVKKTILTKRAYEGEIQDDVKKYLEDKGLTRQSFSPEERSQQATDFINKFGEDAAYRAVESGDIDGGMAASVLAQLQIRNSREMSDLPMGSDERDDLAKKQADIIALMEKKGYLGGEFNGQLAHEYQNAELDYANVKRQVEKLTEKPLTEAQDKKIKTITAENEKLKAQLQESEAKLIDETDKAFKAGEESVKNETNAQKAKRVADKLREKAKLSRPGVFSSATPASLVWDGAIEITAKSIEAGGKLADAIDEGIKHIKESDWYKSLPQNKKDLAEKEFKRFNNGNVGSTDLTDLQERFVDKTDNKFSTDEARDIWGYMKKTYIENGVSYKDALSKTAQDLGLSWRQVSEAITTPKLKRASDEMWKRQADLARNRAGIKNWISNQNKSVLGKALQKLSGLFRGVAVFGHGGIFVGTHAGMTLFNPSMWNKTIPAFFRGWRFAYGNEANYERSIEELKNSPNYLIAQRAGLKNNPERINTEEYQKSQKYLGKLGLAGERGFNAIKVLRQDLFDYHFNKLTPAERDDPAVAKSIAHIVNLATGATNVKIPSWVNEASFAGGMEASRWEKLTASPIKATQVALNTLLNPSKATTADRVFAKVWAIRVGEQVATFTGALLANAAIQNKINPKNPVNLTNPDKPDFMKFKFGDVTIDPTSGMRSAAMFMRTIGKIPFESKQELHGEKRVNVLGEKVAGYARGKLAPLYGTAADFFSSQDFSGNVMPYSKDKPAKYAHKLTWGEYAWDKAPLPIAEAASVFYQSAQEHGAHKKTLDDVIKGIMSGAISGSTGFRVGEYDANAPENKKKK